VYSPLSSTSHPYWSSGSWPTRVGKGLGGKLLIDALYRSLRVAEEIAVKIVIVYAKYQQAKDYYQHIGFVEIEHKPLNLFLPIGTAIKEIET
jgi:hypothetical protein